MEIQNLINCIENNGLHYITCRLQMTWGQSDKVELTPSSETKTVGAAGYVGVGNGQRTG